MKEKNLMFEWLSFQNFAIIGVAFQFGGMAFFAFIFSPMIFKFMASDQASKFLRQVFPIYYRLSAGISIFPALMKFFTILSSREW